MARVLVTCPNLHWIHVSVAQFLIELIIHSGHNITIKFPSLKPYENYAHHTMVELLEGPWEFWLSIDDDNPPAFRKNPLDLVKEDRDIVGFPTPVYHFTGKKRGERPVIWNAYSWDAEEEAYREFTDREGLQEVDAVGCGMILYHRRVFEHPEMQKAPFTRGTDQYGRVNLGADLAMCQRAKKAGFRIWCAFEYPCDQFSELSMNEMARAFSELHQALGEESNG